MSVLDYAGADCAADLAATSCPSEACLRRIRNEFIEMPGLRLTIAQAARLWSLDVDACTAMLDQLVDERVLRRTRDGRYASVSWGGA